MVPEQIYCTCSNVSPSGLLSVEYCQNLETDMCERMPGAQPAYMSMLGQGGGADNCPTGTQKCKKGASNDIRVKNVASLAHYCSVNAGATAALIALVDRSGAPPEKLQDFRQYLARFKVYSRKYGNVGIRDCLTTQFKSEEDLLSYYTTMHLERVPEILAGVIIDKWGDNGDDMKYTIRTKCGMSLNVQAMLGSLNPPCTKESSNQPNMAAMASSGSYTNVFMPIQQATVRYTMDNVDHRWATNADPAIFVQRFPEPAMERDTFIQVTKDSIAYFFAFIFLVTFTGMVKSIVEEKSERIKEGMGTMGMTAWAFWLSWIIFTSCVMVFFAFLTAFIVIRQYRVFRHTDWTLLFAVLAMFGTSMVAYGTMCTTFFDNPKLAASISGFLFMSTLLPYKVFSGTRASLTAKIFASLLSPIAFALSLETVLYLEELGEGASWGNAFTGAGGYSLAIGLTMMTFDLLLYLVLTWYLDQVLPSEYGQQKHWLFFINRLPWSTAGPARRRRPGELVEYSPVRRTSIDSMDGEDERNPARVEMAEMADAGPDTDGGLSNEPLVEPVDPSMVSKVQLLNLRKEFVSTTGKLVAVDDLSLEMYQGQVFGLLGHNGAGKTTTIRMLTGMYESTSGSAYIEGMSVTEDMTEIRKTLGVCPQHSILWPLLTVREHLELYAALKGVGDAQRDTAIDGLITQVGLSDKANAMTATLSGGQRRKLSLAIALIGNPRVVFMDEPTSGMGPQSRREAWQLIRSHKEGKVIVLTTHDMTEADILSDRIGILSHGRLKICGSPLFLKKACGVGYILVFTKGPTCDTDLLMQLMHTYCRNLKVVSHAGTEISFRTEFSSSREFPDLFDELDRRKAEIGFLNYGVSVTTLEEVFLKIAETDLGTATLSPAIKAPQSIRKAASKLDNEKETLLSSEPGDNYEVFTRNRHREPRQFWPHFRAVLTKRYNYAKRDLNACYVQVLVPIISLVIGLSMIRANLSRPEPLIPLSFHDFSKPVYIPFSTAPHASNHPNRWETMDNMRLAGVKPVDLSKKHSNRRATLKTTMDMELFLLNPTKFGVDADHEKLYGAFFLDKKPARSEYHIFYNNKRLHSLPVFYNALQTQLWRERSGNPHKKIQLSYHPLPASATETMYLEKAISIMMAISVSMSFSFIPTSYVAFVVRERQIKCKHQQLMSGLDIVAYWCANYIFDFGKFLLPTIISAILIQMFHYEAFTGDAFLPTMLVFLLYGMSVLSFTYMLSFCFQDSRNAQQTLGTVYLVTGMIFLIISSVLMFINPSLNRTLSWFFRLFPNFSFGYALLRISLQPILSYIMDDEGILSLDVAGWECIYMGVSSIVYFAAALFAEYCWSIPALAKMCSKDPALPYQEKVEDSDVTKERDRIQDGEAQGTQMQVCGLRKAYPGQASGAEPHLAVHDMWFAIPEGEIFGLLGVNGAGKTTTISMLTGEIPPTDGNAYLNGYDIYTEQHKLRRQVGYCPQTDPLLDLLTGREHLEMYALLKGIPAEDKDEVVSAMLSKLGLMEYAEVTTNKYSGGNKRKLSVAIALIGSPSLVFLDEPSTGMDPVSRRWLWNFITQTMHGRCVIITTHSMEEAEALCQRIAIMVAGRLRCLGTTQHLKNKFAQGYQMQVKCMAGRSESVKQFVSDTFPSSSLTEEHGYSLRFFITTPDAALSGMFRTVESNRNRVGIQEYALCQTTLEQVFLHFAKEDLERENDTSQQQAPDI